MRKSTLLVAFAAALLLIGTGCDTLVTLDKPNVTYEAINGGAALRLEWTAVTDAESYKISYNGMDTTITGTSIDIGEPTDEIQVRAVNGNDESDPATIDCGLVETASLTLYDRSDPEPTHPSGLAFKSDGKALALSLDDANKADLDFVVDSMVGLYNAGNYGWAQNSKGNALQDAAVTVFEDATFAPAAGNYWTGQAIAGNAVYYLWLDPTNNNWDDGDHYAKMKVQSWESSTKTLVVMLAYQPIGGLRWLVD
jgi:hypothetical protein